MGCELKPERLAAYLDGELAGAEAAAVEQHVRTCPQCAAEVAERMHLRRSLVAARNHFAPDPEWKKRMLGKIAARPQPKRPWMAWVPTAVALAAVLVLMVGMGVQRRSAREEAFREVADLHVSDLASDHPVDVVSTDRHTVKPWFTGRIPFSFNVPEMAGTEFNLIGGRVAYLQQEPGAQLIVGLRQHRISVLIFRDTSDVGVLSREEEVRGRAGFNVVTWGAGGLRFVVIGDADAGEIGRLAGIFRQANP